MAKINPVKRSFNAGEFSPLMYGQTDFAKWGSAVKYIKNFIPMPQGPARRRGGTYFVGSVKNNADRVWLGSFEYSTTQAFTIEAGPYYFRFYYNHGRVLDGENNILEVATPYSATDLNNNGKFGLSMTQSGDVIYITCHTGAIPPYKLTRNTNTEWTMQEFDVASALGPFADINSDKTITVYTDQFRIYSEDGATRPDGTPTTNELCTIFANSAIFQPSDVGSLFYIESSTDNIDDADIGEDGRIISWEVNVTYHPGQFCRSDGKYYENMATSNVDSGTVQPTWTAGIHNDGGPGVPWRYSGGGWGVVEITEVVSDTEAKGKILLELQPSVSGEIGKTYKWAFGDWSNRLGYPQLSCFFRSRLVFCGRRKIWSSVAGDLESFNPMTNGYEIESDDSINDRIDDTQDSLQWMITAGAKIFIGTAGSEFTYGEQTTTSAFGAGNTKVEQNSAYGSSEIQAVRMGSGVAFAQRAGRKIMAALYEPSSDGYSATDTTICAPHITASGIGSMDYQQEPNRILWCSLANGDLRGLTYNTEQDVVGWHRHDVGGEVECVKCIPDPNGGRDELWMVVKRTINGEERRYIEYMTAEYDSNITSQADATVLDCMLTYSGDAATTISGLEHLEGETVSVVTDGATHADRTVTGGAISLDWESSVVHVGYNNAAEMITLPLEGGQKRYSKARIRFVDTLGGRFGDESGKYLDPLRSRDYADNMDEAPPLFNGSVTVPWPGAYNEDGCIRIVQDLPQPMTIISISPLGEMEDD